VEQPVEHVEAIQLVEQTDWTECFIKEDPRLQDTQYSERNGSRKYTNENNDPLVDFRRFFPLVTFFNKAEQMQKIYNRRYRGRDGRV
jgi:hypothetical protein